MKKRIKIDSAILSFIIILTGVLYQFRDRIYPSDVGIDNIFDFWGLFIVLSGTFLRMIARGYKKANSKSGHELVAKGPYTITRNPMYLGSFLMGAGFILIVWPWWSLPVFGILFYLRFRPQILREEGFLKETFGKSYVEYTRKVARLFPNIKSLKNARFQHTFPREFLWTTKERWGLLGWPLLAVLLESFQEKIVFGATDLSQTLYIFIMAAVVFTVTLAGIYKYA